jgi:hypothetical protein
MKHTDTNVPLAESVTLLHTRSCRQVVAYLLEAGGTWDVRTLADELARLDPGLPPDPEAEEDPTEQRAVYLYHSMLPKLADADAVVFDHAEQTVAPGPRLEALGAYLLDSLNHPNPDDPFGGAAAHR